MLEFSENEILSFRWARAESYEIVSLDDGGSFVVASDTADLESIYLNELCDPDSKQPVHIELANIDPWDPSDCFEFINKWGLLGTGFRWKGFKFKSFDKDQPTLADTQVLFPKNMSRLTSEIMELDGGDYFDLVFQCEPEYISLPRRWGKNLYNLPNFEGMNYYREWIGEQYADEKPVPKPIDEESSGMLKEINPRFLFSFSFVAHEFQSIFQFAEDIERHLGNIFPQDVKTGKLKKQTDVALPIENTKVSLDRSPHGGTQITFWPRTLIDCCYVLAGINDLKKCLNCNKLTYSNNLLHDACADSFKQRRLNQAQEFKKTRDDCLDTNALPPWPQVESGQNPRHPATLLEGDPLNFNPERTMTPEELELARGWAGDYKKEHTRSTKKRGDFDLLLDLLIE